MSTPIYRTLEEPVRIGFMDGLDWFVVLLAVYASRLVSGVFYGVYLFGISYQTLFEFGCIGAAIAFIRFMKYGKPRGYLLYTLLYWMRPNRYR